MAYDSDWANTRLIYRQKVGAVLDAIDSGRVDESDLNKLRNFCMTCLMLMGKVQEPVWRKSERDADIAGLLRELERDSPYQK